MMSPGFQRYLEAMHHLSPASLNCHRLWLSHFETHCRCRSLQWDTCRAQDLAEYHQALLWQTNRHGKLYSSNSVDLMLRVVRQFYRWARGAELIKTDPTLNWRLPRAPQPDQPVLTQAQMLALVNLPDLSQPLGLRDQLLLELLSSLQLSISQCRALLLDQVGGDYLDFGGGWRVELDACKLALDRYLTSARPRLAAQPTPFLLLTRRGQPFRSDAGLGHILIEYGQRLGLVHPLNAMTLHRSHRAQLEQLARRHFQGRP